jgi:hypothetical protein
MVEVGLGYLVKHDGRLWLVVGYNGSWAWLERLQDGQVQKHELSETTLTAKDIHNPVLSWGFLQFKGQPPISRGGVRAVYRGATLLEPLREWVPSPYSWELPARGLYLPPTLKLTVGETLRMVFNSGHATTAKITQGFGTLASRKMTTQLHEPQTRWQMIEDL